MTRRSPSWPADPVDALAAATAVNDVGPLLRTLDEEQDRVLAAAFPEPEPPRRRPPGDLEILALKAAERARRRGRIWPERWSPT